MFNSSVAGGDDSEKMPIYVNVLLVLLVDFPPKKKKEMKIKLRFEIEFGNRFHYGKVTGNEKKRKKYNLIEDLQKGK